MPRGCQNLLRHWKCPGGQAGVSLDFLIWKMGLHDSSCCASITGFLGWGSVGHMPGTWGAV